MNADINISGVILKTERLILREWTLDDLDDFYEYAKNPDIGPKAGWLPHKNKEESLEILKKFIENKKVFCIEYNHKAIGSVGIEPLKEEIEGYENKLGRDIGYVLSKDYWGLGIMPEVVNRVIEYCFNDCHLDFLTCGHFVDNNQSQRVQEKCGFKHIKLSKFVTYYGVTHDCWISILVNKNG